MLIFLVLFFKCDSSFFKVIIVIIIIIIIIIGVRLTGEDDHLFVKMLS